MPQDRPQAPTGTRTVTIANQRGLHARAAAKFVGLAGEFSADIRVSKNGQTVSGKSILGLMMLAAARGTDIEVTAVGDDAERALDAICAMVEAGFEED